MAGKMTGGGGISAGDIIYTVTCDTGGVDSSMDNAEAKIKASTENIAQSLATVGAGMTVLGGAIVAPLALGVTAATDFGSAMASIASLGTENMGELETAVRETAVAYGLDLTEAARGTYDAISSGADAFTAPKILEDAARAAAAGQTDLTTSIQMGMGVANAYGIEFENMGGIFDAAFIGVNKGVMSFEQLADGIGKATPAAAANKIAMEELIGSAAALTLGNVKASEAFTQINAVITGFTRQGESAKLETLGLQGALEWLSETTGGNKTAMLEFLGSTEAMGAALALTGAQSGAFTEIMADMGNKTGAAKEAFDIIAASDPSFAWKQLKAAMQDLAITVGQSLLPAIGGIVEFITPIVKAVADWMKENETLTTAIIALAGAFGTFLLAIGPFLMLMPGIVAFGTALGAIFGGGVLATALTVIGGAFTALAGVITGGVLLAFAAVVAAGYLIMKNWDEIKAGAETLIQVIAATPIVIAEALYNIASAIASFFVQTFDGIVATASAAMDAVIGVFGAAWDYLTSWFSGIGDGIRGILEGLGLINGNNPIPPTTTVPGNAAGGPVYSQQATIVGERGPELFVPRVDGRILRGNEAAAAMGGTGGNVSGGGVSLNINMGGVTVRNDGDIQRLSESIASVTMRQLRAAGVTA
jgi:TP901 family phage tail tape measure protein